MKKLNINFQINFTNRAIYTFIALAVFLVIGVTVFAFGTSNPSTFGHSAGELDLSEGIDGDMLFLGETLISLVWERESAFLMEPFKQVLVLLVVEVVYNPFKSLLQVVHGPSPLELTPSVY